MDTWLITGANGFLGANACLTLKDRVKTVGLVRKENAIYADETIRCELSDIHSIRSALHQSRPKVILHCAALANHSACEEFPELAEAVNVQATRTLADLAKEMGSHFVYISTDAVFDGKSSWYSEMDEPNPFSHYGESKLRGEFAALTSNPNNLAIRTSFFGWSPNNNRSILEFFVNSLRAGNTTPSFVNVVSSSIYVNSLIENIWKLVEQRCSGIVHLGASNKLSRYQLALEICRYFDLNPSLLQRTYTKDLDVKDSKLRDLSLSTKLFTELTGDTSPTQQNGLLKCVQGSGRFPIVGVQ